MLSLALAAAALLALSGLASLCFPRGGRSGERAFAALMLAGGALCVWAGLGALLAGTREELALGLGASFRLDPLAAAFLLPIGLLPALAAVFACEYWSEREQPHGARRMRAFHGLLTGAMAGVVLAGDALALLYAWEVMALAGFFLVVSEDRDPEVRQAGWIYLAATHAGSLALFALFALLGSQTQGFALARLEPGALGSGATAAVLLLALVGFGLKAGIAPLHVWLPGAHAHAPSHVSAMLSGVLLKVGVYGLVRVLWMLPALPRWWPGLLFALGASACVFGIAMAAAQRDYKRLLAYSSIENVGVIFLALGLLSLGLAGGAPALAALGLAALVLHVWNHALFKGLLFLVAGSLLHATGTRDLSALGGLARSMPRVAALALVGCLAISALPPLNGFVSEWLLYTGLLRGMLAGQGAGAGGLAAAAVVLALTGALSAVAFVKFFASAFLGNARSSAAEGAADPRAAMLAPMVALAVLALAIGLAPRAAVGLAARAAQGWPAVGQLAEVPGIGALAQIGALAAGALALGALLALWLLRRAPRADAERPGTWDCGYAEPSARMQYGPTALGHTVVGLFSWVVVPEEQCTKIEGPFPRPAHCASALPDAVLDRGVLPLLAAATRLALRLRVLQRGRIQTYVLYILLAVVLLLFVE